MLIDFNFDNILVANKDKMNWGINCPNLDNDCKVLND